MNQLIIASGSKYRHQRLKDAGLNFSYISPDIDETPLRNESPDILSSRLAKTKAEKIAERLDTGIVFGSDQVASVTIEKKPILLGKPLSFENAKRQLMQCSGNSVIFHTALHLIDVSNNQSISEINTVEVKFRKLGEQDIENYLRIDEPFDCAGSFKMEKAGILLFESITSTDPNALIGMPMIALTNCLEKIGYSILDFTQHSPF